MTLFIQLLVVGLGTGAIYALLALGVVVVYRSSGVINFAQSAFAVMAGFLFAPLVISDHWAAWPAFAVVVLAGGAVGFVIYWGAMRLVRRASTVTQAMTTLAILLIFQGIAAVKWGAAAVIVEPFLPNGHVNVGGVVISEAQMILVGIACLVTLGLWAASRFTLVGLALRAVAENPRAAAARGWSVNTLGLLTWGLAAALGAAAGILIAPITGVTATNMTTLLLAALAAALLGGFESFPLTLLAAMLIGTVQTEVANYVTLTGASDAVPFVLLIGALVVRGRGVPTRGHVVERAAEIGSGLIRWRYVAVALIVVGAIVSTVLGSEAATGLTGSLGFGIVLLSIVLLTGLAGQISLGQMAFAGIGALVAARLVESAGFPFVPAALVGVVATVPLGFLFAIPALRTRGVSLAIVTFGLGEVVNALVFQNGNIIGTADGTPVGSPTLFGWAVDPVNHARRYALVALVAFAVCAVAVANLRRSRVGRRLIAVRANERAAASLGVNVFGVKMYAFGVAAAIAALGGVLLGFQFETVSYAQFGPFNSVLALGYGVIGGVGFIGGAMQGSLLAPGGIGAWIFSTLGTGVAAYLSLIGGVGMLFMLLQNPNGLQAQTLRSWRRITHRWARRAPATASLPIAGEESARVPQATLAVRDVEVRFGGVKAVDGVSLTLRPGVVSALIGPNGAGKTTVIDAITGFVRPQRGTVTLGEQRLDGLAVYSRARLGVGRQFQSLELFEGVSVGENLRAAAEPQDGWAYVGCLARHGRKAYDATTLAAIREFGLEADLDKMPSELPHGRRRLVGIARAIASRPSVLLLDEPVAGLDEGEAAEFAMLVRALASRWGIAVLIVEHDMPFVMSTCDDITVIDSGRPIAYGPPDEIRRNPDVIAAYLGEESTHSTALDGAAAGVSTG